MRIKKETKSRGRMERWEKGSKVRYIIRFKMKENIKARL